MLFRSSLRTWLRCFRHQPNQRRNMLAAAHPFPPAIHSFPKPTPPQSIACHHHPRNPRRSPTRISPPLPPAIRLVPPMSPSQMPVIAICCVPSEGASYPFITGITNPEPLSTPSTRAAEPGAGAAQRSSSSSGRGALAASWISCSYWARSCWSTWTSAGASAGAATNS